MEIGKLILLSILLISFKAFGEVEVGFLKLYRSDGKLLKLDEGEYSHVIIKDGNHWVHAHPYYGVSKFSNLENIFTQKFELETLSNTNLPRVDFSNTLGLPYDHNFDWTNNKAFYCSELIAKKLHVLPRAMKFNGDWKPNMIQGKISNPGVSPSYLYEKLMSKGFKRTPNTCIKKFEDSLLRLLNQ